VGNILTFLDWAIITIYFVFVILLGIRFGKRQISSENYFLGKRNFPGWAVGISMFATIISSWAFIALPGKAFKDDLQYLLVISTIPVSVLITVRFLIPLFREKIGLSAYEYLEKRFGFSARIYGNLTFIVTHFGKMGAILFLLCLAISGMTGWSVFILIAIVGITTIVYTLFGGIEGVVWTDVIQGLLLIGGGVVSLSFLLFFSSAESGEIVRTAFNAGKFKLLTSEFSWQKLNVYILILFGFNFYLQKFVSDQTVVQRYLLSPSKREAARSLWLSTGLITLVWILFMTIGALLWSYYELNPTLLPESVRIKPDQVFPYFIASELPPGITGIILAGLIAATMSTLSSDLNSLASVLLEDYYKRWNKNRSDTEYLFLSRLTVLITGILSIFLAMAMTHIQSMADAAFHFVSIVAGGVMGMYFLGMMTRRTSSGALYIGIGISLIVVLWIYLTSSIFTILPDWMPVLKLNTLWLGLISNILVFTIGLIVSLFWNKFYRAEYDLTIYEKTD
jgi:SSS family solute:Na+ symporter